MVFLDLKNTYLQIPVHPESRKRLRFSTLEGTFLLRFSASDCRLLHRYSQRVMASVSFMLRSPGIRLLRYLDDLLILAKSLQEYLWARDKVPQQCQELDIQLSLEKSQIVSTQVATYLDKTFNSTT